MSRRSTDAEQEFGSDSFLDIIANIVGILIILIVVAGVKVARQGDGDVAGNTLPAAQSQQLMDEPSGLTSVPTEWPWADSDQASEVAGTTVDKHSTEFGFHNFLPGSAANSAGSADGNSNTASLSAAPSADDSDNRDSFSAADLDRQIAELTLNLRTRHETTASTVEELTQLLASEQEQQQAEYLQQLRRDGLASERERLASETFRLQQSVLTADEQVHAFRTTVASLGKRRRYVHQALQQVQEETLKLREVLETTSAPSEAGDRLNHRLSPVGEAVVDNELHFRLHNGRIAYIPLPALLERLKEQVANRRNVVMKFHRYEGMVGPVEGFLMQYIVQRQAVSALQAIQRGQNAFQISVSRWTILPAETLDAEPVLEALKLGSRFRQILESTAPDTTVTLWLYPDDFGAFHELREFAHGLNLRVAARPLPEGTPIAGSPNGSRSTSQ